MGVSNIGEPNCASLAGDSCRDARVGGLAIIGPTAAPLHGLDLVLSCPSLVPVEVTAERMTSWHTVTDEVIEVTRLTSHAIRRGSTAVVHLNSHRGDSRPVPPESQEFVCVRLGQIMLGLADVPSFVVIHSEQMARALIFDSLGDDDVDAVAVTPGGFPVWELTSCTMFPGVLVAACPGDRPMEAVTEMIAWFETQIDS